ncbi:MAG: dihydroxyacetone kinase subunit L [Planctomycetes bacterium]|nr:dihydroxyacetone kinase subunit L [Planctomycetota bacterium]
MESVGYGEFASMLRSAADQVRANQAMLSQLDSVGGDGDHGTTMARAMGLVEKAIAECKKKDLKSLLNDIGWAVMGVDGGATGPLFGTFFLGMAEAVAGRKPVDAKGLAALFGAGLRALHAHSKAQVGDKTMMDALIPAVAAMRSAAEGGQDVTAALAAAATAAEQGALSTRNFPARFGRAKNLGDRTIGHQDPGATSVSLIFRGFSASVAGA